jgi:2-phosphosulfolactate phosphatase
LRPAAEDLWGAGAFIAALIGDHPQAAGRSGLSPGAIAAADLSPEARAALAAWQDIAGSLPGALADCASGRELIGNGYPGDVTVAGERTDSAAVPVLLDGWFTDATSRQPARPPNTDPAR